MNDCSRVVFTSTLNRTNSLVYKNPAIGPVYKKYANILINEGTARDIITDVLADKIRSENESRIKSRA
jgi:hypothetical protein